MEIGNALDYHCPDGIDVYFDNVGGETLDAVLARLNEGARLPICGQISEYDATSNHERYGIKNFPNLLSKHATVTGFSVRDNMDMFDEFVTKMAILVTNSSNISILSRTLKPVTVACLLNRFGKFLMP